MATLKECRAIDSFSLEETSQIPQPTHPNMPTSLSATSPWLRDTSRDSDPTTPWAAVSMHHCSLRGEMFPDIPPCPQVSVGYTAHAGLQPHSKRKPQQACSSTGIAAVPFITPSVLFQSHSVGPNDLLLLFFPFICSSFPSEPPPEPNRFACIQGENLPSVLLCLCSQLGYI